MTIAVSVVFSGIVALTLSPALAALLIRAKHGEKKGFFKWFDDTFERVTNSYVGGVKYAIQHWLPSLGVFPRRPGAARPRRSSG